MNVINLPTEDDAQVTVTLDGTSYILNLFDCEECLTNTRKRLQELGVSDYATYIEVFRDECNKTLKLPLGTNAASIFLVSLDDCLDEFKKKFGTLQPSQDSTEPSEVPTPDSNSSV
jgi:hypothetical protein